MLIMETQNRRGVKIYVAARDKTPGNKNIETYKREHGGGGGV